MYPPRHELLDQAGLPRGVIQGEAEPAARRSITKSPHGRQPPWRQRRVGVEEEQPLPGGGSRSGIHLTGAPRRRPAQRRQAVGRHDGLDLRVCATIDHDDFDVQRGWNLRQQRARGVRVPQDRRDDGNEWNHGDEARSPSPAPSLDPKPKAL